MVFTQDLEWGKKGVIIGEFDSRLHSNFHFPIYTRDTSSLLTAYIYARGVMVIVTGIGHGDTSSNPGLIAFHITPLKKLTLCHILPERRDWVNMIYMLFLYAVMRLYAYLSFFYHIYPTPSLGQDMTQGQFLSGV